MACPTCDHTMANVGRIQGSEAGNTQRVYHCSRCGTLKTVWDRDGGAVSTRPSLVERSRKILEQLDEDQTAIARGIGFEESILLPVDRKGGGS